jgi:hypothetical protein
MHTSLYDCFASIAKEEEKLSVCFESHACIMTKEEKFNVGFEPLCGYFKIGGKILCVIWAPM